MFAKISCEGQKGACKKELFQVEYNTESREYSLVCANCGYVKSMNNIFSRRLKNVKSRRSKGTLVEVQDKEQEGSVEETNGNDVGVTIEKENIKV